MTDNFDTAYCLLTDAENLIDNLKDYIRKNYEELEQYGEEPEIDGQQIYFYISNIRYALNRAADLMFEDLAAWEEYNKQLEEEKYENRYEAITREKWLKEQEFENYVDIMLMDKEKDNDEF